MSETPILSQLTVEPKFVVDRSYPVDDYTSFVTKVKSWLNEIAETGGRENKIVVCRKLMDYLVVNKWFFTEQPTFANAVRAKLEELDNDWDTGLSEFYRKEMGF